uniref:Integrase catalytic domain-containing protein n=1 Tax=Phytophthora ramorum TaxID=164328 RepID=H3GL52_PHYRM
MPGFGVDSDGDVVMTTPQPIFEFIRAPRLTAWSQAALIQFKRERAQYEKKIEERCTVTNENKANLLVSIKMSVETRVLDHLARFILRKTLEAVTDADIVAEIERKCGTILNAHVPDVMGMFKEWLNMDLQEQDIEARISKYFVDFGRLVEEKGFIGVLGSNTGGQVLDRQKMKLRCRILVENLAPTVLQVDVKRLVEMTHRDARTDDVRLYQLIVERATMQHHFHVMQKETKEPRTASKTRVTSTTTAAKTTATKAEGVGAVKPKSNVKASVGGKVQCWVCKGGHKMRDCPTATDAEKDAALAAWREQRKSQPERAKHVAEGSSKKVVLVNSILEIPLCPDTGSDRNIISRDYLNEQRELGAEVTTAPLAEVPVVVLEGPKDKFLLGRVTLKEIGIDIDYLLEQLASGGREGEIGAADEDDLPPEEELRFEAEDGDVAAAMGYLVDDAVANGFAAEHVVPGATPFRCKLRKYPERQRAFLRKYVQQLVDAGLVMRNNDSRWACAALPVKKSSVPLAAATPNLAVVTQSVKGASDSALHFQAQMQECFRSLLYNAALVWINDILLFARSPGEVLEKLRAFFIILRQRNLKLNAVKCKLFSKKVVWCGKVIDESMVDYARTVAPLQHKLEEVMVARGRHLTWTKDDESAFRVVLKLLSNSSKMFFPDRDAHVCLFSDASASGWAVVLTQVREWPTDTPVEEQHHEMLPTAAEVKVVLGRCKKDMPPAASIVEGLATIDGKIWIPSTSHSLLVRLFIVAHCGVQGHRGEHVMAEQLSARFSTKNLAAKVAKFVRECLLCKHVKGGKIIQRAWTTDREVSMRNERLHMDYLFLGDRYGSTKYVLVLKDELTHFCELVPADSAGSEVVVASILDWFKRFGLPESWESDNGSYFKAEVMARLCERLKANQSFVPVYTPWINGTVERINRDILQVLRAMILEFQLDTRNWLYLLPLIQANLNHSPVASLGNHAPIEVFTGLPAPSALDTIAVPSDKGTRLVPVDPKRVSAHMEKLRNSLHAMHKEATT